MIFLDAADAQGRPLWTPSASAWAMVGLGAVGWLMVAMATWDLMRPSAETPDVGLLEPIMVTISEDPWPCSTNLTHRAAYARLKARGFDISCGPWTEEGR